MDFCDIIQDDDRLTPEQKQELIEAYHSYETYYYQNISRREEQVILDLLEQSKEKKAK